MRKLDRTLFEYEIQQLIKEKDTECPDCQIDTLWRIQLEGRKFYCCLCDQWFTDEPKRTAIDHQLDSYLARERRKLEAMQLAQRQQAMQLQEAAICNSQRSTLLNHVRHTQLGTGITLSDTFAMW